MQELLFLTRVDFDRREASNSVVDAVGQQNRIRDLHHARMPDEFCRGAGNPENSVCPKRPVTVEGILVLFAARVERFAELGQYGIRDRGVDLLPDDHGTVSSQRCDDVLSLDAAFVGFDGHRVLLYPSYRSLESLIELSESDALGAASRSRPLTCRLTSLLLGYPMRSEEPWRRNGP